MSTQVENTIKWYKIWNWINFFLGERKNEKELKLAFSEFYLSLIIIQDYQKFNMLGFQKILKKFDKNLTCKNGAEWLATKFSDSELNSSQDIEKLIVKVAFGFKIFEYWAFVIQVEKLFTNELEKGNRKKAMTRLKVCINDVYSLKISFQTEGFIKIRK